MALIKTIKELAFDMMFENMSVMDMLTYYNNVAKKHKLPEVKFNIYQNIKSDIDEELYCKEDPLVVNKGDKTISLTNLDFVSKYFPVALPFILRDYDIYDEVDDFVIEEIIKRVIAKSKKLQNYDIDTLVDFVLDYKKDITLNGCMTTDMLLEKLIECDEEGEIKN